jgi:hypothetical protein
MTSKAQEIYDALVANFPQSLQPITTLSKNSSGNRDFILSSYVGLNFDLVKNIGGQRPIKEKTPDALFLYKDRLYFVEFKEGEVDPTDVRLKIHEALLALFHFAITKKIVEREQFFLLDIRYAVVMRVKPRGNPSPSILDTLEATATYFNLQNMEGMLVNKTQVAFRPKSISKLLHKISGGNIAPAFLVNADQVTREAL